VSFVRAAARVRVSLTGAYSRLITYQLVGMVSNMPAKKTKPSAKSKLLDAAVSVIRARGYSATTVDDLCGSAGVTKGGFFHHFESKEALAVSAAGHFGSMADDLFLSAS